MGLPVGREAVVGSRRGPDLGDPWGRVPVAGAPAQEPVPEAALSQPAWDFSWRGSRAGLTSDFNIDIQH